MKKKTGLQKHIEEVHLSELIDAHTSWVNNSYSYVYRDMMDTINGVPTHTDSLVKEHQHYHEVDPNIYPYGIKHTHRVQS